MLAAACVAGLWGCATARSGMDRSTPEDSMAKADMESVPGHFTGKASSWKTASGLAIEEIKRGSGKEAKDGSTLVVFYLAKEKVESGKNKRVHSTHQMGHPFSFKLGAGEVIKGWEEGLQGMQEGGHRRLTVPPHLGYGARTVANKDKSIVVGKNATVVYDVKLIEVK
jgi:FKBP-type peptidyl-prolyl cis-trans isomerase